MAARAREGAVRGKYHYRSMVGRVKCLESAYNSKSERVGMKIALRMVAGSVTLGALLMGPAVVAVPIIAASPPICPNATAIEYC
jgi:hypothetical protein